MKNPNIGHPPKYAFLAQMSILIPSSSYELHCVPVTKMLCVRLPASHSSPWPTVEAIQLSGCSWFEGVSMPTILGWAPVCHSWQWMSCKSLWAYCFGLAEGANQWRPLYMDNLHCCFGVQFQWATTCGLYEGWEPYTIGFKLSLFAAMWGWVLLFMHNCVYWVPCNMKHHWCLLNLTDRKDDLEFKLISYLIQSR